MRIHPITRFFGLKKIMKKYFLEEMWLRSFSK